MVMGFPNDQAMRGRGVAVHALALLGLFAVVLFAMSLAPFVPEAHAAKDGVATNRSSMHVYMTMPDGRRADAAEVVMTLNGDDKANVKFEVVSGARASSGAVSLSYELVDVNPSGNDEVIHRSGSPTFEVPLSSLVKIERPALRIMEVKNTYENAVVVDRRSLNIRIADVKKAESKVSKGGWSISNGVNIKLGGTSPGGFFKDMTLSLSAIILPVTYKHNSDGTTVVGINCSANDMAFYKAVKNRNVWQKYSDKALADMAKGLSKGLDGKGVGTWGSKGIDWTIAGYAEFKTKDPDAPWTVTLVGTYSMKFAQSAQYYILTGTVSGKVGAKFLGSLTRDPKKDSYSGYLDVGGQGTLELFGGLGAGTIAAVGVYGRGTLEAMVGLIPKSNFGFKSVSVTGDAGIKAVAFNFDIVRWVILEPKKSPYYLYQRDKKLKASSVKSEVDAADGRQSASAPAATPADVRADAAYPEVSRSYLDNDSTWTGADLVAGTSPVLSTQADTLVKGIYGATDLVAAETKSGPVIAYIADGNQVGVNRDSANRAVLVYSRYKDGAWTQPKPIDVTSAKYGKTPDYNPYIFALPDGDDFYVTWLDAASTLPAGEKTIGSVAKNLSVRFARVKADDAVDTSQVMDADIQKDLMGSVYANGSPAVYVNKVDNTGADGDYAVYVAWATNEAAGDEGQVIGVSGKHRVVLASWNLGEIVKEPSNLSWRFVDQSTESGAITSLSVGKLAPASAGGQPTVAAAFSLDKTYAERCKKAGGEWTAHTFTDLGSLDDSAVYKMVETMGGHVVKAEISKIADHAANVQFITANGVPTLAYAKWARADESGNYCSVFDANGNKLLDGQYVGLPTPAVKIAGDIGAGAGAGMVTFTRTNKAAGVAALAKKGASASDWGKMVDATDAKTNVTGHSVVYHDGKPMIIFTTAQTAGGLSAQSEADESVDLEVASGDALLDVNIEGVYYDEMEVDAGQVMPVTVEFANDGVLPLEGVDVYLYADAVDDEPVLVASTDEVVESGEGGSVSFEMQLPKSDAFKSNLDCHLAVLPKGATGVSSQTMGEEDDSTFAFALGDPHLVLETEHRLVDGQESIVATVTNEGMVTSKPATLVFERSANGADLKRVVVPALAENATFKYEYKAKGGYFQGSDIESLTVTLEDPNDPDDSYSLYNTDGVYAWEIGGDVGASYKVDGNTYKVTSNDKDTVTLTKARNAKKVVVPAAVKIQDKVYKVMAIAPKAFKSANKKLKAVVVGKNVATIGKAAFKGCSKLKKVTVKSANLTKKGVKGSLRGSAVKTIAVNVGKAKANKSCAKTYKKIFAKGNSGRAVAIAW